MATVAEVEVLIKGNDSDLQSTLRRSEDDTRAWGTRIRDELRRLDVVGAIRDGVIDIGRFAINAAVEFETSFANVERTVDGTEAELSELRDTLRDMATSETLGALENAHTRLAGIAAIGGQLGVATEDLDEFTQAVAAMSIASDGLDPDVIATYAARFASITGMDIGSEIDNWSSAVADLGNRFATTEEEVMSFSNRLASLSTFGFDEQEILAYGATLSSLGISAELGGSNLVRAVSDMTSAVAMGKPALATYAEVAGMTSEEFAELAAQDPESAFEAFVVGLSELDADEQLQALQGINATGSEQQRVFMSLASATDLLADAQVVANEGWEDGNVHMEEAARMADTTQGSFNRFKNSLTELGIEMAEEFLPGITKVTDGLTEMVSGEGGLDTIALGVANLIDSFEEMSGIDLGAFIGGAAGEDTDMVAGLQAFIDSMDDIEIAATTIWDNIGDAIGNAMDGAKLKVLEVGQAMLSILPDDMLAGMGIDMETLDANISEIRWNIADRELADAAQQAIMEQVATTGTINLDDIVTVEVDGSTFSATLGEALGGGAITEELEPIIRQDLQAAFTNAMAAGDTDAAIDLTSALSQVGFDPAALAETIGVDGKAAVTEALQTAFAEGDEAAISVLTPIANELQLDVEAIRNDIADGIANETYEATATVDVIIAAGTVNFDSFNATVRTASQQAADQATAGASASGGGGASASGGAGASDVPGFHEGGIFNSGKGEGLALLRDGEMVLTPDQTKMLRQGGGGRSPVVNNTYVQSYGQHPAELTRMIDRTRRDAGR